MEAAGPPDRSGPTGGWVAPEAPPEGRPVRPVGAERPRTTPQTAPVGSPTEPGPAVELPVPLRPLTAGDILDGAVRILKARPRTVFGVIAILVIPYNVLVAYLQRDLLGGSGLGEIFSNPSVGLAAAENESGGAATLVSLVLGPLVLAVAGVAVGYLVGAWYGGADPPIGDVLTRVGRRLGVLFVAFVAVHLLELVGFLLLFLPGLAVMALSVVTSPVIGTEDAGPFASIRRSWTLCGRRFLPVLGLTLLTGFVVSLIGQVLLVLPTTIALALGEQAGWLLLALAGSVVGILTTTLQAGTATLILLDLRVRTEGLDLGRAADRHLGGRS